MDPPARAPVGFKVHAAAPDFRNYGDRLEGKEERTCRVSVFSMSMRRCSIYERWMRGPRASDSAPAHAGGCTGLPGACTGDPAHVRARGSGGAWRTEAGRAPLFVAPPGLGLPPLRDRRGLAGGSFPGGSCASIPIGL